MNGYVKGNSPRVDSSCKTESDCRGVNMNRFLDHRVKLNWGKTKTFIYSRTMVWPSGIKDVR